MKSNDEMITYQMYHVVTIIQINRVIATTNHSEMMMMITTRKHSLLRQIPLAIAVVVVVAMVMMMLLELVMEMGSLNDSMNCHYYCCC